MNHPLADDHSDLNELLEEVFAALETDDVERIYQKLDLFWARLAMHIRAEHLHLFPAIIEAIETGKQAAENSRLPSLMKAQNAISELRADHNFFMREFLAAIKQMRDLRENSLPVDAARQISEVRETIVSVNRRLETHNKLEETEVYLWADALFSPPERACLDERMKKEIKNLPPRFCEQNLRTAFDE